MKTKFYFALIAFALLSIPIATFSQCADEPCSALVVPLSTSPCSTFTTIRNSCGTSTAGVPAPGCSFYNGNDVWVRTSIGANGQLSVNFQEQSLTDICAAIYTGPCSSLTLVTCDDNSGPGNMPFLYADSLTPGSTVWIRIWDYAGNDTGSTGICISNQCLTGNVAVPLFDNPPCPPPATLAGYLPFTSGPCANYTTYSSVCSNTGLSNSPLPLGTSDPVGCSGPYYPPAGFTTANWDVWAAFIIPSVPATGFIDINTQAGTVQDLDIAIYRINGGYGNNCNNAAAYQMLMCDDFGGPGFMPYLHLPYGGANPVQDGDTIMIRMWDYFGGTPGDWGMCINNPCPGGTVPTPAYDDPPCPATAVLLPVTSGPCVSYQAGDNICAGATIDPPQSALCGFPNGSNDVWYVVQMPLAGSGQLDFNFQSGLSMNDPVVSIYSGTPNAGPCFGSGLTLLACDDDGDGPLPYISLSNPVAPGQYLYIRVHGYGGERGTFGLCVNDPCGSPPANDVRCNPTPLTVGTSCNFITASINCASTDNFGVPAPGCGNYNGRDVWYSFTAPSSGSVVIDSREGTLTDIGMAVYHSLTGNDCTAGFILDACDDNTGIGNMPFISLTSLTPGSTYWLRVWESGGNQDGNFRLCIYDPCSGGSPANDAPCNAQLLSLNNSAPGFNNCATAEAFTTIAPNSPTCWTHQAPYNTTTFMNTVWYKVVGDTTYTIVVSPVSMTRPQVSVWKPTVGQTCGSLTTPIRIAGSDVCNNGSAIGCKPSPSSAIITLDGGQVSSYTPNFQATDTLYIGVDGVNGEIGTFEIAAYNMDLNSLPPLAIYDCRRAVPISGKITTVSNPGFTNSGNICDLTSNTEYKTFTSSATATSNAAGTITLAGSDSTNRLSVGMIITAAGGTGGTIPYSSTTSTRIISITDAKHFVVSPVPSPVLIGSTITAYVRPVYTSTPGASSAGSNITVGRTAGLNPGMTITVTAGAGAFPAGTTVVSITNATTFVASSAPTVGLTASSVITGTRYPIDSRVPEVNSAWYFFSSTGTAGTLTFDITGNSDTNYDYYLWDITSGGTFTGQNTTVDGTICAEIRNSGTIYGPPLRANVAYSTGPTGVGSLYTTNTSYSPPVTVPGSVRTYMLCIINNDGNGSGFTLEFSNFSPITYSPTTLVWDAGSGTSEWNDPANWGGFNPPGCAVNALVNNNSFQPVITGNASVNNLTIQAGASLTLASGATLSICGNFQNYGTFIADPTSTVQFVGTTASGATGQVISGNFVGANKFPNLVIDKPVVATLITTASSLFQTVNVSSTAGLSVGNAVFLTSGTGVFRMGTTIASIPGIYTSAAGAIGANYPTYTSAAGATGTNTFITVGSTVGLYPGMVVSVTAGIGAFSARTYVTNIINGTQFTVSTAPTTSLSGGASVVTATGNMIGVSTTSGLAPGQLITVSGGVGAFPAGTTATAVLNQSIAGGSSVGTTITVGSTANFFPGMMVTVTAGTGSFAAGTRIMSITNSTQFVVSASPTVALSGATIVASGFGTSSPPTVSLTGGAVISGGPIITVTVQPSVTLGTGATIKASAGIVTLSTNADISGNLSMTTNTSHLNATGRYIKLAKNYTNASGNATFNPTSSTMEFNGTGVQTFINNGSIANYDASTGFFVLNNVIINQQDPYNDIVELSNSVGIDNNMRINGILTLTSGRIFTNQWEVLNRNPFPTAVAVNAACASSVAGTINPVCNNSYIEGTHTRNVRRTGANETYTFAVGEAGYAEFAYLTRINSAGGANADTLKIRARFNQWPGIPPNGPVSSDCASFVDWSNNPSYDHGYWTLDSLPRIGTAGVIGPYHLHLKPNNAVVGNTQGGTEWSIMKRTPSGTGAWAMDGTCNPSGSSAYDVYRSNLSGFSDFAITQSDSATTCNVTILPQGSTTLCTGNNVQLNALTGTGFTYQWKSNGVDLLGETDSIYIAGSAGNYSVVVSNGLCTDTSADVTVIVNSVPNVGYTISPSNSVCAGSSVILNGTGASTYSWSGGITNGVSFIPDSTRTYIVSGTTNGCSDTASVTVTVKPLPNVGGTASPSNAVCTGTSVTLNGTGASSYSWTGGITNGVAFIATNTQAYIVTGTSANGCIDTATVTVTVTAVPNVGYSVSPSTTVCRGTSVTLNGTGASTYSWSGGITNGVAFIPNASNTYIVTGTTNGCSNTASVNITVNQLPIVVADVSPSNTVCSGSPVVLTGNGASTYSWNFGVVDGVPFTATITRTYIVSGTDLNGCSNTASLLLTVNPLPNVGSTVSPAGTVCSGTPVTLNGTGALTYSWSGGVINGIPFTPIVSGTYTVTGTGANGCSKNSSRVINVNPAPASQPIIGNPTIIPFQTYIYAINTVPGVNFSWSIQGGAITSGQNTNSVNVIWGAAGPYSIQVVQTNSLGCTNTSTQVILNSICSLVYNVVQSPASTLCQGDTVRLVAQIVAASTFQWYKNGLPLSGQTDDTLIVMDPGLYQVQITSGTCTDINIGNSISFLAAPVTPAIISTNVALGCNTLYDTLACNAVYPGYLWNTGATTQTIVASSSGNYTVTVTGLNGCQATSPPYGVNISIINPSEICIVSVDSLTGKNIIIWEKPSVAGIDSFYIYKETTQSNVYAKIASLDVSVFSTFIDVNSIPQQHADRYTISVLDTCGYVSLQSIPHKTIHLSINQGLPGTWNLIWDDYEGFGYGTFYILRGTNPNNLTDLDSIQGTLNSYTDLSPPVGAVYYAVEIRKPAGCNPTARIASNSYYASRSNVKVNTVTGLESPYNSISNFQVVPNPASQFATILFSLDQSTTISVNAFDITGREVKNLFQGKLNTGNHQFRWNLDGDVADGVYFITIRSGNASQSSKLVVVKN